MIGIGLVKNPLNSNGVPFGDEKDCPQTWSLILNIVHIFIFISNIIALPSYYSF